MPLYELFCISRARIPQPHTKNLLRKSALTVMANGGVVRAFENYGENRLAYKIRQHHERFREGRQWTMLFDGSPQCAQQLQQQLRLDSLVVRHGVVRVADTLRASTEPALIDGSRGEERKLRELARDKTKQSPSTGR